MQDSADISRFTTAVFDLVPLAEADIGHEAPKTDPRYYFRPYKTILVRTVADGGESFYVQGDHRSTVPTLYHLIVERMGIVKADPIAGNHPQVSGLP